MNQITPYQLKEWRAAGKDFLLVDIRESWERDEFNIGGLHIPMDGLLAQLNELPKDKEVVLYCERGIRTVIAIQRLEDYGFHNLFNLSGGMVAWKTSS